MIIFRRCDDKISFFHFDRCDDKIQRVYNTVTVLAEPSSFSNKMALVVETLVAAAEASIGAGDHTPLQTLLAVKSVLPGKAAEPRQFHMDANNGIYTDRSHIEAHGARMQALASQLKPGGLRALFSDVRQSMETVPAFGTVIDLWNTRVFEMGVILPNYTLHHVAYSGAKAEMKESGERVFADDGEMGLTLTFTGSDSTPQYDLEMAHVDLSDLEEGQDIVLLDRPGRYQSSLAISNPSAVKSTSPDVTLAVWTFRRVAKGGKSGITGASMAFEIDPAIDDDDIDYKFAVITAFPVNRKISRDAAMTGNITNDLGDISAFMLNLAKRKAWGRLASCVVLCKEWLDHKGDGLPFFV